MFKIGDFSRLGQVSTRMLRHYDKLGLLVPQQVDDWTGYRYYTIHQLPRLHRIIALKEMGLSLQQIAALLDDDDSMPVEQLRSMLLLKRRELAREVQETEQRLAQVEARLAQLDRDDRPPAYETVIKSVAALPVASLQQRVPHVDEMGFYCRALTRSLYRRLKEAGIVWGEPELILYHSEEYRETDLDVEACVALPAPLAASGDIASGDIDVRFQVLPAHDLVASLIYEGAFEEMIPAILELMRWVGLQRHRPLGPLRELHLSGPAHAEEAQPALPVVELQLPVAPV